MRQHPKTKRPKREAVKVGQSTDRPIPAPPRPEFVRVPDIEMKILQIDIETAPHKVYAWGLFNQNIGINQIQEPGYTLCFAAKWYGRRGAMFHSLWTDGKEGMVAAAHALLSQADAVIHYNGKKFDIPTLNRDFITSHIAPPDKFAEVDLYHVVRSQFRFASNKLDYVCSELGLGTKLKHKGMELWHDVMEGKPAAQRTMQRYNMRDVFLLERLYNKVLPWIKNHPNHGLFVDDPEVPTCRNCGSKDLARVDNERTWTQVYLGFKCNNCGTNLRSRKTLLRGNANVLS